MDRSRHQIAIAQIHGQRIAQFASRARFGVRLGARWLLHVAWLAGLAAIVLAHLPSALCGDRLGRNVIHGR